MPEEAEYRKFLVNQPFLETKLIVRTDKNTPRGDDAQGFFNSVVVTLRDTKPNSPQRGQEIIFKREFVQARLEAFPDKYQSVLKSMDYPTALLLKTLLHIDPILESELYGMRNGYTPIPVL